MLLVYFINFKDVNLFPQSHGMIFKTLSALTQSRYPTYCSQFSRLSGPHVKTTE